MKRLNFRGETEDIPESELAAGWHLRSQWAAPETDDPAMRAAVAMMPIDNFVAPATMIPRGFLGEWPVMTPSLDLAVWFHRPDIDDVITDDEGRWWNTRTAVPVSHLGFAVGRTQVWGAEHLLAEGMSQVALVPMPDTA
jgi:acyl-CoA thioesterase